MAGNLRPKRKQRWAFNIKKFNQFVKEGQCPSRQNVKDKAKRAIDLWDNLR
jgi:hypothetical protein